MPNERARDLRRDMTPAERKLWAKLRGRQLMGARFRRQHPLGPYIVDFVCLDRRFIVEVDGGQHGEAEQKARDERRTAWLESEGYRVIRVWNNDVMGNADGVMEVLRRSIGTGIQVGRVRGSRTPHLGAPNELRRALSLLNGYRCAA